MKTQRLFFSPTNHKIGASVKYYKGRKYLCVYLQGKGIQLESFSFSTGKLLFEYDTVWRIGEERDDCSLGSAKLHLVTVVFLYIVLLPVAILRITQSHIGSFLQFQVPSPEQSIRS